MEEGCYGAINWDVLYSVEESALELERPERVVELKGTGRDSSDDALQAVQLR